MGRIDEALIGDLYEMQLAQPSDIVEHLPYFVELAQHAQTVIELGVRTGVSTVAWLYGLEQSGGHLWSVDIAPAPSLPSRQWTFILGDDLDVVGQLPDEVDVVFIDTSHHYQRTLDELAAYLPKVRSGGTIVLHDTELEVPEDTPAGDPPFPVKTAIAKFCDEHQLIWSNRPNCWGLASISVP